MMMNWKKIAVRLVGSISLVWSEICTPRPRTRRKTTFHRQRVSRKCNGVLWRGLGMSNPARPWSRFCNTLLKIQAMRKFLDDSSEKLGKSFGDLGTEWFCTQTLKNFGTRIGLWSFPIKDRHVNGNSSSWMTLCWIKLHIPMAHDFGISTIPIWSSKPWLDRGFPICISDVSWLLPVVVVIMIPPTIPQPTWKRFRCTNFGILMRNLRSGGFKILVSNLLTMSE